jgi:antitoxin component YwqK of YwqJK toxin-antitoxin module
MAKQIDLQRFMRVFIASVLIFFTTLFFTNCLQKNKVSEEKCIDYEIQSLITDFSEYVFDQEVINSKEILDHLLIISDTIFEDTAKYYRTPKATVYANNSANTYFQIFEKPKETITVIMFYKNKIQINAAEYYDNGRVMCKWKVTKKGIRDGHYYCFYEDGTYRITGFYKDGVEINDSNRVYKKNGTIICK